MQRTAVLARCAEAFVSSVPCYHPLAARRGPKGLVDFRKKEHDTQNRPITVACGKCRGCRLESSRQWAMRIMHEAQVHEANCFATLTYNPENLPDNASLHLPHFQEFMRSLRYHVGERCLDLGIPKRRLRYFHCGEYGELSRPHYHLCLFGWAFLDDRQLHHDPSRKPSDAPLYTSELLDRAWGKGFTTIGELTFESAAYTARYIMKKVNGPAAIHHYAVYDDQGGKHARAPEYTTMSRRPGIGSAWYDRFKSDLYPSDTAVTRGYESRVPRYYDKLLEKEDPDLYDMVKQARIDADHDEVNSTPERLRSRELVAEARSKLFNKRKL